MTMGDCIHAGCYAVVLAGMFVYMFVARHEGVFSKDKVSPVLAPFRRCAVYGYKRWLRLRAHLGKGGQGRSLLVSEQVRADLATLDAPGGAGRRTISYAIGKITTLLLCLFLGALLGLLLALQGQQERLLQGTSIMRPAYGEGDSVVRLKGNTINGETTTYDVTIRERQYTQEEAAALFADLVAVLPEMIRGDNADTDHVRSDLRLPSKVEGYPFYLAYTSDHYALLHDNGKVYTEELTEGESVSVTLTVKTVYEGNTYHVELPIVLLPPVTSEAERFTAYVQEAITQADEDAIYGSTLHLPQEVNGISMEWEESSTDRSTWLFLLVLFSGGVACYVQDRQLRERVQRREQQMSVDYPQVVSKITLFLGAGMSVRNIFYKLGNDYQEGLARGREVHDVYEEIQLMCRELDSGTLEEVAYRNFAGRCRLRPYTKLVSLLTQNLQKGNSALLPALTEEAAAAFEERKMIARRMGEEAGTKMLLPMMLMLVVTLVIIVVPAYLGFV